MPSDRLSPDRLQAFSDGVIAVIITIMVLELKVPPPGVSDLEAVRQELPLLLVYLLSFVQIGIYWVNHHYLVEDVEQVTHGILWSNLALLFALSLIPAATDWVGIRGISSFSISLYSVACVLPGVAWLVLSSLICRRTGTEPDGSMLQQFISFFLYVAAAFVSWYSPRLALGMIGLVAVRWLLPPRHIAELTRHKPAKGS
jgi:uncharacterized membrane protein